MKGCVVKGKLKKKKSDSVNTDCAGCFTGCSGTKEWVVSGKKIYDT